MNPNNPTATDLNHIEHVFFHQMKMLSRRATAPRALLNSFDFQCSDEWR